LKSGHLTIFDVQNLKLGHRRRFSATEGHF